MRLKLNLTGVKETEEEEDGIPLLGLPQSETMQHKFSQGDEDGGSSGCAIYRSISVLSNSRHHWGAEEHSIDDQGNIHVPI